MIFYSIDMFNRLPRRSGHAAEKRKGTWPLQGASHYRQSETFPRHVCWGPSWGVMEFSQPLWFSWSEPSGMWVSRVRVKEVSRYKPFKSSSVPNRIHSQSNYQGCGLGTAHVSAYLDLFAIIVYTCALVCAKTGTELEVAHWARSCIEPCWTWMHWCGGLGPWNFPGPLGQNDICIYEIYGVYMYAKCIWYI